MVVVVVVVVQIILKVMSTRTGSNLNKWYYCTIRKFLEYYPRSPCGKVGGRIYYVSLYVVLSVVVEAEVVSSSSTCCGNAMSKPQNLCCHHLMHQSLVTTFMPTLTPISNTNFRTSFSPHKQKVLLVRSKRRANFHAMRVSKFYIFLSRYYNLK